MYPIPLDVIDEPPVPIRSSFNDEGIDELAHSLAALGQLQPIVVQRDGHRFRIVAGHRRYLAARALGWKHIDAAVRDGDEQSALREALTENTLREEMNPYDEARAIAAMFPGALPAAAEVSRRLGKSRTWATDRLTLLSLPEEIQIMVATDQLPLRTATMIARAPTEEWALVLARTAVAQDASRATVRAWVDDAHRQTLTAIDEGRTTLPPALYEPPPELHYPCWACTVPRPLRDLTTQHVCRGCLDEIARRAPGAQKGDQHDG